jgi:hypothetical protein
VKSWKKINQECRNWKQAGIAILILDKAEFKQKSEEISHYILIKGIMQQEDIIILNIYVLPHVQINTSEHEGTNRSRYSNTWYSNTRYLNTWLSSVYITSRQKLTKICLN